MPSELEVLDDTPPQTVHREMIAIIDPWIVMPRVSAWLIPSIPPAFIEQLCMRMVLVAEPYAIIPYATLGEPLFVRLPQDMEHDATSTFEFVMSTAIPVVKLRSEVQVGIPSILQPCTTRLLTVSAWIATEFP